MIELVCTIVDTLLICLVPLSSFSLMKFLSTKKKKKLSFTYKINKLKRKKERKLPSNRFTGQMITCGEKRKKERKKKRERVRIIKRSLYQVSMYI